MPYFDNLDTYINPYYLDVTPAVRAEMYQRALYYGARTRTGINSSVGNGISNTIEWPYQKMPWAYVTSKTYDSKTQKSMPIILGFDLNEKDGAKVMSDETGMLTLYESVRNVPKLPLLTSIEISNEGQRGALLKGKFSFTFFPSMLPDGFELEAIQRIFFTPGSRVNIGFGWSVSAFNQRVNKLEFTGIIYGFNWSFNQNTSISAEVQVVSPSTLAIGLSGEQTVFPNKTSEEDTEPIRDPTGRALPPETNIITIIQRDLRNTAGSDNTGVNVSETGKVEFLKKDDTISEIFNYFKIGLPTVVGSSFEDSSAGRILLTDMDRAVEQQQAFAEAVAAEVTESMALQGEGFSEAIVSNAIPDKKQSGEVRLTSWNQEKMTASEQLYRFLNDFEKNKGDNSKEKREWLDKWKKTYEKSNMGRYVFHEQIHNNIKKINASADTWSEAYWASIASIQMKAVAVGRGSGDLDADSFDNFLLRVYEKPTYEERVIYIKRKIAQLGAQEIEELKNFMYYGNPSSGVKKIGITNASDDNIRAYHKFFYIQQTDQSSADGTSVLKKNTLQRDKYFWPDSLNFIVLDDDGKIKELNMKNMWQTFNDKIKNLRDKYDGKTEANSEQQNKYIGDVRADKNFETILNNYIIPSSNYAKNGKSEIKEEEKKEIHDKEDSGKKPKEKVTPEQKQKLDLEINELSNLKSMISRSDVFSTKDNPTKKEYLEKYTKDTFVGGIDVKSIEDNWLTDFKYPPGTKNELIPPLKSGAASKFVQKLIDAKKEQKETGIDNAKNLIKTKSPAYQERLNNASTQNGEGGTGDTGTGTGDTGTGDTGGVDPSADAATNSASAEQYQSQLVGQTYWYITLKDLVEFANKMMERFEGDQENSKESKKYNFQKFRIQCENNETEYQPDIKSAFPQDVYFPDISMGGYQTFNPFYDNEYSDYLRTFDLKKANSDITGGNIQTDSNGNRFRIEDDVINIGNILVGINLIINVYRQFLVDNATNIPYKNITSFFDQIIRSINAASGDTYQLVSHLFSEPETLTELIPKVEEIGEKNIKDKLSVLSIEDTHIARKHSQTIKADERLYSPNFVDDSRIFEENMGNEDIYSVKPFVFEATIFKPLIKNVSISSKPPKELAFAAYIAARGQEANEKGGDFRKSTPYSGDAMLSRPVERDEQAYKEQDDINKIDKKREEENVGTQGFTQEWCDNYRSILTKAKRLTTKGSYGSGRSIPIGGHWLNKAIYPVEFTVTIDGINGFKFGDVLKTTMIPRHYNVDWDMVFTVTKILHKVTPSTWETTLNTAARLSLDSPLTGISATTDRNTYIDPNIPPVRREIGENGPNPDEMRRQPG